MYKKKSYSKVSLVQKTHWQVFLSRGNSWNFPLLHAFLPSILNCEPHYFQALRSTVSKEHLHFKWVWFLHHLLDHLRFSQTQHYWHFSPDNSLFDVEVVLYIILCLVAFMAFPDYTVEYTSCLVMTTEDVFRHCQCSLEWKGWEKVDQTHPWLKPLCQKEPK